LSEREAPRVDEVRPFALDDLGTGRARKLHGVIARARIEHEERDAARQTREGARQVPLFVAGEDDGGD
jgi:hypothetical protein